MRGRITAMWVVQSIEGVFCILMGLVTVNFDGPDEPGFSSQMVQGIYEDGGVRAPSAHATRSRTHVGRSRAVDRPTLCVQLALPPLCLHRRSCRHLASQITYTVNGTLGAIGKCSSKLIFAPATGLVDGVATTFPGWENGTPDPIPLIKIKDPGSTCVHNQGTVGMTMFMMVMFSLCVQARATRPLMSEWVS